MGQQPFRRHSRGCKPTAQGQACFDAVAPAIDALESAALPAHHGPEPAALALSVTRMLASHGGSLRSGDGHGPTGVEADCVTGRTTVARLEQASQLLEAAVARLGVALAQRCLIDVRLISGQPVLNGRGGCLCHPLDLRRFPMLPALRQCLQEQAQEALPN